jgi:hypothetical protein
MVFIDRCCDILEGAGSMVSKSEWLDQFKDFYFWSFRELFWTWVPLQKVFVHIFDRTGPGSL